MRFYTAQPASRVSAIKCGKDVVPDWSKHPLADPNAKAYRYLLDKFDNAPEGLEGSERYAAIEAAADNLDTAHDNITEAIEALRAAME